MAPDADGAFSSASMQVLKVSRQRASPAEGSAAASSSSSFPPSAGFASGRYSADPAVIKALFLGFMFAFAVKAPLWPFHRWLPDAAVEATPASAVLMMAVMDKVGTIVWVPPPSPSR